MHPKSQLLTTTDFVLIQALRPATLDCAGHLDGVLGGGDGVWGGTCVTCEGREGPPGGTQGSVSGVSPGHVLARHFPVAACVMYTPSDAGLCWAPGWRAGWRASEVEAASFLELHLCRHLRHIRSSVTSVASLPAPAMCVLFSS